MQRDRRTPQLFQEQRYCINLLIELLLCSLPMMPHLQLCILMLCYLCLNRRWLTGVLITELFCSLIDYYVCCKVVLLWYRIVKCYYCFRQYYVNINPGALEQFCTLIHSNHLPLFLELSSPSRNLSFYFPALNVFICIHINYLAAHTCKCQSF